MKAQRNRRYEKRSIFYRQKMFQIDAKKFHIEIGKEKIEVPLNKKKLKKWKFLEKYGFALNNIRKKQIGLCKRQNERKMNQNKDGRQSQLPCSG